MVSARLLGLAVTALVAVSSVQSEERAIPSSSTEVLFAREASVVNLMQHQSRLEKGRDQSLPNVSDVLVKPNAILDTMTSHISALEDDLGAYQRKSAKHVAHIKASYESNLTAQHHQNRAIRKFNAKLSSDIETLDATNARLRNQADDYMKLNKGLAARLRTLQGNLSVAEEFVSIALNRSSELLDSAPELQVLRDLGKQDEERSKRMDFNRAFDMLGKGAGIAAMQVGAAIRSHDENDDAKDLLHLMSGALGELQDQQQASEAALLKQFETTFQEGVAERAQLLSVQAELNSTKAHALEMQANLTEAVTHLQTTKTYLLKQVDAVRSFASSLGEIAPHANASVSLLQIVSDKDKDSLPGLSTVLRKPSAALDSANRQVTQLLDRLEKMHQQGSDMSSEQKKEYDRQLSELNRNISQQQQINAKTQEEIDSLDQNIASLRAQAEQKVKNNKKLREDVAFIQGNLTIAQEYLVQLLNDTHEPLAHTKALKVLHELKVQEAARSAQQAHEEQLNEVSMIALLQVQGGDQKQNEHSAPARDIIGSLQASVDTLEEEHKASQLQLQEEFGKEFRGRNKTYHKLVRQWGELNATRFEKAATQHKLELAVEHLEHTSQVLEKRRDALVSFAGKIASLPSPVTPSSADVGNTSAREKGRINLQTAFDTLTGLFSRTGSGKRTISG